MKSATGRALWKHLRSERGDADPVLTIVSMFVSALITVTVLGVLVIVIQFGGNFVTDQLRSTTLATAQKAWSQDAANASEVKVRDAKQATFYEEPGYRPGVYVPRGDDKANQCRKSVWTLSGGVLSNTVSKFSQAKCDLVVVAGVESVDASITPVSTVKALSLDGVDPSTGIVATNAANRDLHFVNGVEIGLVAGSAAPSTNTRDSWWRDYEWVYPQPERINLVGKVDFPVSGERASTLRGDTSIVPTRDQPASGTPETPPVQTVYDPGPLAVPTVTRSSTTGAIFPQTGGGVREGINVQFSGVSCGPYSTQYDVVWSTSTPGSTPTRSASETTFDKPLPIDLDKVPNGAVGFVTVTASCPTSTKPSTVTSHQYTQPLPTPVLTATAGTPPNVHTLTWAAVTSLAAQYSTDLSQDGSPFTADAVASPNPTTATTETITYPLGSTYGVSMAYQVTAAVGPTSSTPSAPKTVATDWPLVPQVTLQDSRVGLLHNVTSDPATCPAGTHPEYSQTRNLNDAGTEPPSPWSTNPVVQYTLGEGDQAVFIGSARCAYSPSQVSLPSAGPELKVTQLITTRPASPTVTTPNPANDADPTPVTYPVLTPGTCPVNTTLEYQIRYGVSGSPISAWSAWSASSTQPIAVPQGGQLILEVHARCVSPYTQGPPGVTTPVTWVRPIPAPAAPIAGHDAGGSSVAKDDRFTYTAVSCPNTTTPAYFRDWFVAGVGASNDPTWVKTLNLDVATNWGFDYNFTVHAHCESPYAISDPSPAASTSWPTPIPTPSGSPTLNLSTDKTPVNTNFGVFLGGVSCPAATQLVWAVAPNGGQVSGSFTTRHSTPGYRIYTASALCYSSYSGRDGAAKAAPPVGIDITAPAAPVAPSSVSLTANWFKFCGNTGFTGPMSWSSSANATSYTVQSIWTQSNNVQVPWTTYTTTSGTGATVNQFGDIGGVPNISVRVRANGPGGSSAWSQIPVTLSLGCI